MGGKIYDLQGFHVKRKSTKKKVRNKKIKMIDKKERS